ncbi:MAG: hypothetical protein ACRD8W_01485 [Nitrososphaeraceae archaeon]
MLANLPSTPSGKLLNDILWFCSSAIGNSLYSAPHITSWQQNGNGEGFNKCAGMERDG